MQKWKFSLVSIISLLLLMPNVLADDAWAHLRVQFVNTLRDIGDGIGQMFLGMGAPLAVFIILLALGSMVSYILMAVGKKGGLGEETYQRPA